MSVLKLFKYSFLLSWNFQGTVETKSKTFVCMFGHINEIQISLNLNFELSGSAHAYGRITFLGSKGVS